LHTETLTYEESMKRLKDARLRRKITSKQYYLFAGQLKGRFFGKNAINPRDTSEDNLKERVLEYIGMPLMEKVGEARDFK